MWYRVFDKMSALGQVGAAVIGGTATGGVWFYGGFGCHNFYATDPGHELASLHASLLRYTSVP